jgi:hypothetical protein
MKTTTRMNGIAARRPRTVLSPDIGNVHRQAHGYGCRIVARSYIRSGAPGWWNHAVSRRDNSVLPW